MKALFTEKFYSEQMESIKKLGYEVIYINEKQLNSISNIKDIDMMVCYNPFEKIDISKLLNLKWIQLTSVGIDQAPREKILENNILLTNNKGGYSIPMGEWIVLKTLEMFKNSKQFYEKQNNKEWVVDTSILELYGKTIGFIGTGTIAKEGAKRLQGFGVHILGVNTNGRNVEYFDKCFSMKKIDYVLSRSDILVITLPYTSKTHHFVNEEFMKKMKDESYLINIARGSIIDENALIKNINSGKIKKAALDVFEKEPLSEKSPLWEMDNIIITPHNSWVSEMRKNRKFNTIYENMERFINEQKLMNLVNLKKGY